jgi:hypothetical protein
MPIVSSIEPNSVVTGLIAYLIDLEVFAAAIKVKIWTIGTHCPDLVRRAYQVGRYLQLAVGSALG